MASELKITVLVENTAGATGVRGEHGLSFFIEYGERVILFDTGASDLVLANAGALGVDLTRVDTVVLSHGHYDHTGGLLGVLDRVEGIEIYLHPAAVRERFSCTPGRPARSIGMSRELVHTLEKHPAVHRVHWAQRPVHLDEGILLTGEIPRVTEYEAPQPQRFFFDRMGRTPDPVADDMSLVFDTSAGLVVVMGCAHAGPVNILRHVDELTGRRRVHALLGGLHLSREGRDRIDRTVEALAGHGLGRVAVGHCTGFAATVRLCEKLGGSCGPCAAGTRFSFGA